jgi:hypothetical protein
LKIAKDQSIKNIATVIPVEHIKKMCIQLPKDLEELYDILGSRLSEKYGSHFLATINGFLKNEDYVEIDAIPKSISIKHFDVEIISDDEEVDAYKPCFDDEFDHLDDLILQEEEDVESSELMEIPRTRYSSLVSPDAAEAPPYFSKRSRNSNSELSQNELDSFLDLDDFELPSSRKKPCSRISDRFQV